MSRVRLRFIRSYTDREVGINRTRGVSGGRPV